jgi:hypothetical protein
MPDIHIAGASRPFTAENAPVAKCKQRNPILFFSLTIKY